MQNPRSSNWIKLQVALSLLAPVCSSLGAQAQNAEDRKVVSERLKAVAESKDWLKLGHYVRTWWGLGGWQSRVDGEEFFLSPEGKHSPLKEVEATHRAFLQPVIAEENNDHPLCKFPARRKLLERMLGADAKYLNPQCSKFSEFKGRLKAKSVSLVFSSFFLNSPSSAFGHSLLRINSRGHEEHESQRTELLDFGINYAANVTTSNPIAYAVLGLVGGFKGTFASLPYYYKVREYNDFEARDLWSYDLNLEPEEIQMLVAHLWELGSTYLDYFYFTENCSYHMLTTLEAAAPRLDLVSKLPFYAIPSQTIQVVYGTPGLVAGVRYRPSVRAQFFSRVKALTKEEETELQALIAGKDATRLFGDKVSKARVLDAALDYFEYRFPEDMDETRKSASKDFKQGILLARANLGVKSEELEISTSRGMPEELAPHRGHSLMRLQAGGGGVSGTLGGLEIGWRFALHDLLDPYEGYPKWAQIEFGSVRLRYFPGVTGLELEELSVFNVKSLNPWNAYNRGLSFNVRIAYEGVKDGTCTRCGLLGFEAGPGITVPFGRAENAVGFVFLDGALQWGPGFSGAAVRLAGGPRVGLLWHMLPTWRLQAQASFRGLLFSHVPAVMGADLESRFDFSKNLGAFLRAGWNQARTEAFGGLTIFF